MIDLHEISSCKTNVTHSFDSTTSLLDDNHYLLTLFSIKLKVP